jgi:hypothetical protein
MGYHAAWGGLKQTFRDYPTVRSSKVKMFCTSWPLKMGPITSPETSVSKTSRRVTTQKTEEFSSTRWESPQSRMKNASGCGLPTDVVINLWLNFAFWRNYERNRKHAKWDSTAKCFMSISAPTSVLQVPQFLPSKTGNGLNRLPTEYVLGIVTKDKVTRYCRINLSHRAPVSNC